MTNPTIVNLSNLSSAGRMDAEYIVALKENEPMVKKFVSLGRERLLKIARIKQRVEYDGSVSPSWPAKTKAWVIVSRNTVARKPNGERWSNILEHLKDEEIALFIVLGFDSKQIDELIEEHEQEAALLKSVVSEIRQIRGEKKFDGGAGGDAMIDFIEGTR
jgi:hypothetical protein